MTKETVVFILYDGVQLTDFSVAADTLAVANSFLPEPYYDIRYVTPNSSGTVQCSAALSVMAETWSTQQQLAPDLIIFPGAHPDTIADTLRQPALVDCIQALTPKARQKVSIGTGSLFLGYLGLCQGRKIVTHWKGIDVMRALCPQADVIENRLYLHDQDVSSCAGMLSAVDLMLSLIQQQHGTELTLKIAKKMVMYLFRDGHQEQQSQPFTFQVKASDAGLLPLIAWLEGRLSQAVSDDQMAAFCQLSVRALNRICQDGIGLSPQQLFLELRLDYARQRLKDSQMPLTTIASETGFSDTASLTSAFEQRYRISPQQHRSQT